MNHETWIKLTPEQQRIKVAELCGWERVRRLEDRLVGLHPMLKETDRTRGPLLADWEIPDYLNDLNAMHEAEMWAAGHSNARFANDYPSRLVCAVCGLDPSEYRSYEEPDRFDLYTATAAQRAEAFVLTMEQE